MHPSAVKEFAKIAKLIDEGKLPGTAAPRLFSVGHRLICGFEGAPLYACSNCQHQWNAVEIDWDNKTCPNCGVQEVGGRYWPEHIFYIGYNRKHKWECVECKHQWIAEEGRTCPSCGAYCDSSPL